MNKEWGVPKTWHDMETVCEWWGSHIPISVIRIDYVLHIPTEAPVARYNLSVESWKKEDDKYVKNSSWPKPEAPKTTIVILFNPWCAKDQVREWMCVD